MRVFVTGVGGLIGSTVAEIGHSRGYTVWGIDSDQRGKWFGRDGSVSWRLKELQKLGIGIYKANFRSRLELVDTADLIVHCASQPSHDFSRSHVLEDSLTNYMGTVELLEKTRQLAPHAVFAFLSTNKVYGDYINGFEFKKAGRRFLTGNDLPPGLIGLNENTPIDNSLHTPFGVSKAAADLMVQEYRRCFGLKTVTFRCGCLTGKAGSAIELQGFLGYLVKCAVRGETYTVYGHEGYQVRDNIDAADVADAIFRYAQDPKQCIYNMGGGMGNSVSVNQVIDYLRSRHGCKFDVTDGPERLGDHKWWVTDTTKFEKDYPGWTRKSVWAVLDELVLSERSRRAPKS